MEGIGRNKQELIELEKQLKQLDTIAANDKQDFLEFAYDFIERMGSNFLNPELVSQENRERCKQIVFPAGFYVDKNNKVYTPKISILYRLTSNKKDLPKLEKSSMVRVRRL